MAARENHCIIKRDKEKELQQHLQIFEKRFEEIHEMKCKVQEMMIKSKAKEEAIDKWTAELDEKLKKIEQPMAVIEEAIKNWERRKSIKKKNQEEFEKRDETGASKIKQRGIRGEDNNKDPKCKLSKLVMSQFNGTRIDYFRFWNQFETQIDKLELS